MLDQTKKYCLTVKAVKLSHIFTLIFLVAVFVTFPKFARAGNDAKQSTTTEKPWSFLMGYGMTHKGLGKTRANVETVDFVVGYERFLTDTFGQSLLRGRHSFVIEVPVHFVVDPWEEPMVGINFLARWTFETNNRTKPYVFGGGGPVYTEANIPGLGSKLNGNWQFGGGLHFSAFNHDDLIIEYRFHHISNLGTRDPNDSLNSSKILFGTRF